MADDRLIIKNKLIQNDTVQTATETAVSIPAQSSRVMAKLRDPLVPWIYAWVLGETATNYVSVPAGGKLELKDFYAGEAAVALYILHASGGAEVVEMETWTAF